MTGDSAADLGLPEPTSLGDFRGNAAMSQK